MQLFSQPSIHATLIICSLVETSWISFPKFSCCLSAGATTVLSPVLATSPSAPSHPPLPPPLPGLSQFTAWQYFYHLPASWLSEAVSVSPAPLVQAAEGEEQVTMPPVRPKVPSELPRILVCVFAADVLILRGLYTQGQVSQPIPKDIRTDTVHARNGKHWSKCPSCSHFP